MTTVQQFLDVARSQLGVHEQPPGSNVTIYGQAVNLTPASWCMQFVHWVMDHSGVPTLSDVRSRSSVGFMLAEARGRGWTVATPAPGDLVTFIWGQGMSWPDHVGIVEDVHGDGSLSTIEGNAAGPDGVGDEVARHLRPRSWEVLAFVRPRFDDVFMPTFSAPPVAAVARGVAPYLRLSGGVLLSQGGAHHDLVATYQRRMAARGWSIDVDGLFGPQTLQVTRQFQTEKRLSVDGVVGPQTWTAAWEAPVT